MALPSGYTQLNYIENTGQAFIDTKFTPTANTRVVMDFQLTNAGTSNRCLFGVAGQFSFRWYGSSSVFRSNGNGSTNFPTGIDGTARHKVDKTATACTLDGKHSVTTTAGTVSYTLYLLAQNNDGSSFTNPAPAKLYSCQIYEGGSLVRDFVPCTNAAGTVGVYDTANAVFYASGNAAAKFTSGGVYDPTAPVGDHNAFVDGAARAVVGGSVLADGTVCEITEGKILSNGTVYGIAFAPSVLTINFIEDPTYGAHYSYLYATIGSTRYYQKETITVEPGTTITVYAKGSSSTVNGKCTVTLDGKGVATGKTSTGASYAFTPTTAVSNIQFLWREPNGNRVEITTS